ncbi:hypothetical protein E1B28_003142 [Marasmius oreades]|uniref:Cytochrome P450 n=1 Tax=Marasmius oreades TaxID=181124 RepID=A0A9P7UM02_9AGAR|nr:uncharacterized protein E1B28_003142 [Marasmius oreades]KAG7085591.1 hypothetical protein E1B28_003142 [Marasmius oreades]
MDLLKSFLILFISVFTLRLLVKRHRRWLHLPPGPKGLPIVGNIVETRAIANSNEPPWVTYSKWSDIYGDIFTFQVLGSRTVILNSYKAIMELLERRSYNYSDRPCTSVNAQRFTQVLGSCIAVSTYVTDLHLVLSVMRYSDWWRLHRKTVHQSFNHSQVLPEYYDIQKERTSLLIRKLATSPKNFFEHVRAHSGETILEIVYGYRTQEDIDLYVQLVDEAMQGMNASGVGIYLVDYFPILKHVPAWFPGARFKTEAEVWARNADRLVNLPWELIQKLMDEGSAVPCFCTRNLEKFRKTATSNNNLATDEFIKNCAATSFLGGAETTVSAVLSFILAMVLNPRIQARAQKELDEITGSARLPEFADRENLPYIHAILLETLRWNPVTPTLTERDFIIIY